MVTCGLREAVGCHLTLSDRGTLVRVATVDTAADHRFQREDLDAIWRGLRNSMTNVPSHIVELTFDRPLRARRP